MKENVTIATVKESVKEGTNELNVNFFKVKEKSEHVVLGFPNKETLQEADKKLSSNENLSVKFSMKTPKKMFPKITITGIDKVLFATEVDDKRDHDKNVVKMDILKRNQFLQPFIDKEHMFDVVVIKEELQSYTDIIKVSPEIQKMISNHDDKLFV